MLGTLGMVGDVRDPNGQRSIRDDVKIIGVESSSATTRRNSPWAERPFWDRDWMSLKAFDIYIAIHGLSGTVGLWLK